MRKLLLYLLFTLVLIPVSASMRSGLEMQNIAFHKLKTINKQSPWSSRLLSANQIICVDDEREYSVYESHDIGFVIVGKNTLLPEVLGYSKSSYDADNIPPAMKLWLSQVSDAASKKAVKYSAPKSVEAIEPFITTRWGQDDPYNKLTPTIGSKATPTGCVATAMAQVINYVQYPASASFMGTYYLGENDETGKSESVSSTYTFPYKTAYGDYIDADGKTQNSTYTDEEATAIATLMRDCGYAASMQYTLSASGTSLIDAALGMSSNFKYPSNSVKFYMRNYYTVDEWFDIVRTELENKCPVIYGGSDKQFGGHAFVLGGMDEDGKVYVNWGWSGSSDGFYDILLLNPLLYYFTTSNDMITGLRSTAISSDKNIYQFATDTPYTFTFNDNNTMDLQLTSGLYNLGTYSTRFNVAVVAEDTASKNVYTLATIVNRQSIQTFTGFGAQRVDSIPLESTLNAGHYQLYIGVKRNSDASWTKVRSTGGEFFYNITVANDGKITYDATPVFTGISAPKAITTSEKTSKTFPGTYNLHGQKVNADYRGIVIKDGRKIIQR